MTNKKRQEIDAFIKSFIDKRERTIVIVDYGNVEKWKNGLKWKVDIKKLADLIKNFSYGQQYLRRFYYGGDYGSSEKGEILTDWSRSVLERAKMNRFEVVVKRVKYIHDKGNDLGFEKKCDLDVEMTVDLIRERDNYDNIVIFSGDGDLMYAVKYLVECFSKICYVFGARDHIGREVIDGVRNGFVRKIFFAEDFEYRLNDERLFGRNKAFKFKNPPTGGF